MNGKVLFPLLLVTLISFGCNNNNSDPLTTPLYIECVEGTTTIQYEFDEINEEILPPNLQYSLNKKEWKDIDIHNTKTREYSDIDKLSKGQKIYFRGDNPEYFNIYTGELSKGNTFSFKFKDTSNLQLKIGGNIMSLLSKNNFNSNVTIPNEGCFFSLFLNFSTDFFEYYGNVDASDLLLPATELKEYSYFDMFDTSSLSKAPLMLPSVTAKKGVYECMFKSNKRLITAPIIKLDNLEESACNSMFANCSELNISKSEGLHEFFKCPKLNGKYCVSNMFSYTKDVGLKDAEEAMVYYFN